MDEIAFRTDDGLCLFASLYENSEKVSPVLLIIHGMGEHGGRYGHVANYFLQKGFHVLVPDHRGHGRSEGQRGHTPSYQALMRDMALYIKTSGDLFPGMPVFIYGHSMGGNLTLNYVLRHQDDRVVAVVASAPYLRLAFKPPAWKVALGKMAAGIYPALSQRTGLETAAISRDEKVVQAYENDPLVHDVITASFFAAVHEAGEWALHHADTITVPALLLHGTGDRLTSWQASETFARKAGEKVSFFRYEGLYHELHNEPEKEQILQDVAGWLSRFVAIR
ncbi:MAG: lysophospholipase [Flavobacteriales bacterium]|nr:lysophospholipase [Flavobacteriales bacterium]